MVITDVNQVIYNGDGNQTAWPFTFKIIDATDLKLTLINEAGARTGITSDYYVDMVNSTVYYPGYAPGAEPPEEDQPPKVQSGEKLEIYRRVPVNQLADLGESWPFSVIEKGLDKLTMICQDIYSWIGRNIVGLNEDGTEWDAKGLPISNVGGPVNVKDAATKDYVDKILTGIIEGGGGRVIPFDTVAQMVDADLVAGQIATTLGYGEINDGGSAYYGIRAKAVSDVNDGRYIIFLNNGNVAEWISQNDYLSYKDSSYTETYTTPVFKSYHQATAEWEAQKALDEDAGTLTVATFNTLNEVDQRCIGDLSNIPLSKQLTISLMTKAQIIGYNETLSGTQTDSVNPVDKFNNFGKFTDGMFGAVTTVTNESYYTYGNMIESAYTLTSKTNGTYTHVVGVEDRGYTKVVYTLGNGKTVSVYSTHLGTNSTERAPQIVDLCSLVGADTSDYKIIMGDMNTTDLTEFSALSGYTFVNTGQYKTYADWLGIDNIIVSPSVEVLDSGMIEDTQVPNTLDLGRNEQRAVSDHSPLWARLKFN